MACTDTAVTYAAINFTPQGPPNAFIPPSTTVLASGADAALIHCIRLHLFWVSWLAFETVRGFFDLQKLCTLLQRQALPCLLLSTQLLR